jgi:hypothetical protein
MVICFTANGFSEKEKNKRKTIQTVFFSEAMGLKASTKQREYEWRGMLPNCAPICQKILLNYGLELAAFVILFNFCI